MRIQDKIKKIFIKELKLYDINFYKSFYKDYMYNNCNIKTYVDSLFNSYNPLLSLKIIERQYVTYKDIPFIYNVRRKINNIYEYDDNLFEELHRKVFVAKTKKSKLKLIEFCRKNGILPTTYSCNIDSYIKHYNMFYITYNLSIERTSSIEEEITLNRLIYKFNEITNKINNIKLPFHKKFINNLISLF